MNLKEEVVRYIMFHGKVTDKDFFNLLKEYHEGEDGIGKEKLEEVAKMLGGLSEEIGNVRDLTEDTFDQFGYYEQTYIQDFQSWIDDVNNLLYKLKESVDTLEKEYQDMSQSVDYLLK